MRTQEAGPSSDDNASSSRSSCVHGRMVNDERTPDGQTTGRLICMECGALLPASPASPSQDQSLPDDQE
jgi:hypothetical protein